ncbi:hypothetical protein WA1_03770 [Scytonema hofmannii PCC 7110]|uniref:Uncharacterized protein n=1 Tax=Scytonema hofmannii PCC 7110 TaxID=128403 RepID=A0A139X995_9CYAN|nr:hypothetical protein [Scytonema hofmannii]KYC41213.1 hypothetical protein WA1_03770 [Scytonema hofmannii PCC 7110]
MGEGLSQLYRYCQTIANYGNQGFALDTTAIKTVRNQTLWEADVTALGKQVEGWWTQAPRLNMIYGPAKAVWNEWIKPNQLIYSLILPIQQNDLSKLDVVKNYVGQLSSETQINDEVKRKQRELGLIRGSSDTITGMALNQIRQHVREAVDFARQWISLQEPRMSNGNNYNHSQAQQLQQDLANLHTHVLQELNAFDKRNSSVLLKAGVYCCKKAIENISNLFELNATLPTVEPKKRKTKQEDDDILRNDALVALMKSLYLKRLESSLIAFESSICKQRDFQERFFTLLQQGKLLDSKNFRKILAAETDEEDNISVDELIESLEEIDLNDYQIDELRGRIQSDLNILNSIHHQLLQIQKNVEIGQDSDLKLAEFKQRIVCRSRPIS